MTSPPAAPAETPVPMGLAPGGRPVLGHAWWLRFRPLKLLRVQRGRGDIVVLRLGPTRAYLVNSPELVHQMLTTRRRDFVKGGPLLEVLRAVGGDGLLNSEGDLHRRQRRLIQPVFKPTRISSYVAVMNDVAAATTKSWSDGQVVAVHDEMYNLSATVMSTCLFSGQLTARTVAELIRLLPVVLEGAGRRAVIPVRWVHALPTRGNRRYAAAVDGIRGMTDRLIADRVGGDGDHDDMLSALLSARDEDTGEPMSGQQVHSEVMTMLGTATETTASTISWVLHLLGHHPDVEARVHTELDEILGGRPPTHADLPVLPYLAAVVAETPRLYPPAWLLPRRTVTDTHLGGHPIPAGSTVFYSPYANHHDPALFPDPESFIPDRWLTDHTPSPRCAHIPFGAGARQCVGNTFATAEVMITLAVVLQHWRLRPHPSHPVRPYVFTTLGTGPIIMTAHRRNPAVQPKRHSANT